MQIMEACLKIVFDTWYAFSDVWGNIFVKKTSEKSVDIVAPGASSFSSCGEVWVLSKLQAGWIDVNMIWKYGKVDFYVGLICDCSFILFTCVLSNGLVWGYNWIEIDDIYWRYNIMWLNSEDRSWFVRFFCDVFPSTSIYIYIFMYGFICMYISEGSMVIPGEWEGYRMPPAESNLISHIIQF